MTPFAIAGLQMYVNTLQPNVDGMIQRLDILLARSPWTQMVLLLELAPYGPPDRFALPPENDTLAQFQAAAKKHRAWLIPGSMFLKLPENGRVADFSIYDGSSGTDAYLKTSEPLEIPKQSSRADMHVDVPAEQVADAGATKSFAPPFTGNPPAFESEPMHNPTAGTATNFPAKPAVLTGTDLE